MSNTHLIPDMASEVQALCGDLLAPCILSTTWPIVPVSSLTLAAFATHGYVMDGGNLIYVNQAAAPVTLSGADGQFWVALHRNTSSAVASWTRQPGTHYVWRSNPTKPAEPAGGLILSSVTVTGGIITAVSQATIPAIPMSRQDANNVAISGGQVGGTLGIITTGTAQVARLGVGAVAPSPASSAHLSGPTGIQVAPVANVGLGLDYNKSSQFGSVIHQVGSDAGNLTIAFTNVAGSVVGSIDATAAGVAFATSSDRRLKDQVVDLPNPLQVIGGLRPVAFRWKQTGGMGRGFLADEVQALIPDAVSGDQDAVDMEGRILPQQVDFSKLVPHLVGAVKALIALNVVRGNQIQALAARVAALEALP